MSIELLTLVLDLATLALAVATIWLAFTTRSVARDAKVAADASRQAAEAATEQIKYASASATASQQAAEAATKQIEYAAASAAASTKAAEAASQQVELARTLSRGEFVVRVDEMLQRPEYSAIHGRLLPWGDLGKHPSQALSDADWTPIISYMGAFERVNALLKSDLLDARSLADFYGYRIDLLVAQVSVRERLTTFSESWTNFIELWHALDIQRHGKHNTQGVPCSRCTPPS